MTRSACLLITGALILVPAGRAAASPLEGGRLRGTGNDERKLLRDALGQSATVRQLAARIEQSDLVVLVKFAVLENARAGKTELLSVVPGTRYLLVTVDPRATRLERVARLGHELRHVVEIADAPEVQDRAGFAALFERIGWPSGRENAWETDQAIAAGRRVAEEMWHAPVHVTDLARTRSRPPASDSHRPSPDGQTHGSQ